MAQRFAGARLLRTLDEDLRKPVPRFVNGWYALGTAMLALFAFQILTGLLLALYYVPTPQGAADSVTLITERIPLGWLVRGTHHWGASLLVILAVLHMLKALWTGAYKRPRELTWVAGVLLLGALLAFGLTGYLLPWDQLAYWGTTVVTDSFGALPAVGPALLEVMRGGPTVGDGTLLRFYILHILVLPGGLIVLVGAHLLLVRHFGSAPAGTGTLSGQVPPADLDPRRPFWPVQVLHELPLVYLVVALCATLAVLLPVGTGTPADPFSTPEGIKPEWYFLPNYQLFKYIPTWLGLLVMTAGGLIVVLLPWWDTGPLRWLPERPMARWAVLGAFLGVVSLGALGALSERTFRLGSTQVRFDIRAVPSFEPLDETAAAWLDLQSLPADSLAARTAALLDERCAGCHGGPSPLMDLDLAPEAFESSTIGVPSRQTGIPLVQPGEPDASYLVMKLVDAPEAAGGRMPAVGEPVVGEELALIRTWIQKARVSSSDTAGTGRPRGGALIIIWAVAGFGIYSAWLKRRQLRSEGVRDGSA